MTTTYVTKRSVQTPMDKERQSFLRDGMAATLAHASDMIPPWQGPAEREGVSAVIPVAEDDMEDLLIRGVFLDGSKALLLREQPSQCHPNTAELYLANPGNVRIMTGYALSDDGVWHQHSWATSNGKILETTEPRTCYFGVVLRGDKIAEFVAENL